MLHCLAELGAIDPSQSNAFPNFMYGKNDYVSALVTDDDDFDYYNQYRANFFGRTQEAGDQKIWYQKGFLMGGDTDAIDMSVYAGEMWLKSELKSKFLSMLDALPGITPDTAGEAIIRSYLDQAIADALPETGNGVISVGKSLTTTQKAYITQVTGDNTVYLQIENEGYWYTIDFTSGVDDSGATIYTAEYTLIYTKADKIRKISGTHVLI